jgi:hypothetical protein
VPALADHQKESTAQRRGNQLANRQKGIESDMAEEDVDSLFKLPLGEFTAARNALAARLKKAGHRGEADRVKSLAKPSVSAWAVNQLYWKHPDAFKRLLAVADDVRRAHASQLAGNAVDTRGPFAARREAIASLSNTAAELLRDTGHHPSSETIRRIATTLEALSAYPPGPDAPRAGRLTADVDPPGFEILTGLVPGSASGARADLARVIAVSRPGRNRDARKPDEIRQARITAAQAALHAAERMTRDARTTAEQAAAARTQAAAHAEDMEQQRLEAQLRLDQATAAAEEARRHLHRLTIEANEAAQALQRAERALAEARTKLEEQL